MRKLTITIVAILLASASYGQGYLFYLHGKIVEEMGPDAVETTQGFGAYEYKHILATFRDNGFTVMSEVRAKNTDPKTYAARVVKQIDSLMKTGVKPGDITVVGASKGAVIAMYVSTLLKNKQANFVFMGGCFDHLAESMPDISYYGNVLSVYEESDVVGRSCATMKKKAAGNVPHYKELELHTGMKHGFLYKPLKEWVDPATRWAKGQYN